MLDADFTVDRREFAVSVALTAAAGERLALFGPSGAGKTTALETIAGLVRPATGRIWLGGRLLSSAGPTRVQVPVWQRRVGLLRQDPCLFPHLTVEENLRYARDAASQEEMTALACLLGIEGLLAAMPATLSGGQAHRAALARLLLCRSQLLLLDEPYTGLDEALRRQLTLLVSELVAARGLPAILVAHELETAQAFADRLAVIDRGQILQDAPPDVVARRPATRRVAELTGYAICAEAPAGTALGVHPDRVIPGEFPERGVVLHATVTARRPSRAGWEADLRAGRSMITCRLADKPAEPGAPVVITVVDPPRFAGDGTLLPDGERTRT